MELQQAIDSRRSLRSLAATEITEDTARTLAAAAALAPSCFNNQPWRFVFAYQPEVLEKLFKAMAKGNEWTYEASMITAVFSAPQLDCSTGGVEYFMFDSGMATGFLMLKAVDMGLTAHAIAGFDNEKVKEILGIPQDMTLITLIIIGKKAPTINPALNEKMAAVELSRPQRKSFAEFAYLNKVEK